MVSCAKRRYPGIYVEELKKWRNISVPIHNLPTKVPKGTNIYKTIGLSVIIIHSCFKHCRNSLVQFTGTFAYQSIVHYGSVPESKSVPLTSFVAFGMRSEENTPKYGEPTAGFSFTTMLQHIRLFGQGFPSKEERDNSGASPILSWSGCSRFLRVRLLKSRLKGQICCVAIDIIKNATEELKRLSQTDYQECLQHLHSWYQKCTVIQVKYFEGNLV